MTQLRNAIIAFFTFAGGLYFFLEFVLPASTGFGKYHDQITVGVQVVGVMAVGLGVINILKFHGGSILRSRKGWPNSLALIIGLFLMFGFDGVDLVNSEKVLKHWQGIANLAPYVQQIQKDEKKLPPAPRISILIEELTKIENKVVSKSGFFASSPSLPLSEESSLALLTHLKEARHQAELWKPLYADSTISAEERIAQADTVISSIKKAATAARTLTDLNYKNTTVKKSSDLLFRSFYAPLGAAMFSLLAFYIANAAYRSFRVKSLEAFIMMSTAIVVILGQIPHGPIYVSDKLPGIRLWLLDNISTPAFRAIFFCSAIAGLALATRMWLSLEKSPLAVDDLEEGKE